MINKDIIEAKGSSSEDKHIAIHDGSYIMGANLAAYSTIRRVTCPWGIIVLTLSSQTRPDPQGHLLYHLNAHVHAGCFSSHRLEMVTIAKGKYEKWLEPDGQILLQGWARDGLTEEQIAHNMGISARTLTAYKKQYSPILLALKKGKEVVDFAVENALLKKALSGDVTAMIFWLKNRRRQNWRDRYDMRTDEPSIKKVEELMDGLDKLAADGAEK